MYNYFPHPSNLRLSSGNVSLIIEEGYAGYGIYMSILEVLRDSPEYRYNPSPRVWAYLLHLSDIDQISRILNNYGLFDVDDNGLLYSPWLNEQMGAYTDKAAKLREAGKRGAARRWARQSNGEAIATPSNGDGEAIAILPNNTLPNIHNNNAMPMHGKDGEEWRNICNNPGPKVDADCVAAMAAAQPGHAPGYVAQVCFQYGIGRAVLDYILRITDNASLTNDRYKAFAALIKRIQAERYTPSYPANFVLSKI